MLGRIEISGCYRLEISGDAPFSISYPLRIIAHDAQTESCCFPRQERPQRTLPSASAEPVASARQRDPASHRGSSKGALRYPGTREEMRKVYAEAKAQAQSLIAEYGQATVLGWVERGLPPEVGTRLDSAR